MSELYTTFTILAYWAYSPGLLGLFQAYSVYTRPTGPNQYTQGLLGLHQTNLTKLRPTWPSPGLLGLPHAYSRPTGPIPGLLGLLQTYWAYTRPTGPSSDILGLSQAYWAYPFPTWPTPGRKHLSVSAEMCHLIYCRWFYETQANVSVAKTIMAINLILTRSTFLCADAPVAQHLPCTYLRPKRQG